jgi:anti-sigma regulatory factor (Ser/Thr protein kinase)
MSRHTLHDVTAWITAAALAHPADLPEHMAQRLGLSRRSALAWCRQLQSLQWLVRAGTRCRPKFGPGALRQVVRHYPLQGLQEDLPWRLDFAPCLALPPEVGRIAQHAFTELLNNAIDHSGGTQVTVSVRQTPWQLQLLVSDDGRGVFDAIGGAQAVDDPTSAMLELAKGKLSTQPDRHAGRGLFFTAKLADVFDLHANGTAFQHRAWQPDQWVRGRPACRRGSSVYVALALDTGRTLDEVMRRYSLAGDSYRFERTVVPLALLSGDRVALESRATARRVAARLLQFKRVDLDFEGLAEVGHGFVDELWRVFGRNHPELQLVPVNMAPRVAEMVASVLEPLPA